MLLYIIKLNYSHDKSLILILHTWLNNKHCICKSFTEEKKNIKTESQLY